MNLHQHAAAISATIQAAYADGYQLDDGDGNAVALDLNAVSGDGYLTGEFAEVAVPEPTF